jgi:hypothetical protein
MSRLQQALDQIRFARTYTIRLLNETKDEDWFRMTPGGVSHVGWQVGHVALAQYRLALTRIRGPKPSDAELIGEVFQLRFERLSMPLFDPASYPSAPLIRATFDQIHEQVLREIATLADARIVDDESRGIHAKVSNEGTIAFPLRTTTSTKARSRVVM